MHGMVWAEIQATFDSFLFYCHPIMILSPTKLLL